MPGPTAEMSKPDEHRRRDRLWDDLLARGGPRGVAPDTLRALRIYGGAQGIWVWLAPGEAPGEGSCRPSRDSDEYLAWSLCRGLLNLAQR